jgi:riboflavin kinase, archaea type
MLETTALTLLLKIAQQQTKETSTVLLAEEIGVSQQSVSRILAELATADLIRKRLLAKGLELTLTGKGRLALLALHSRLGTALGGNTQGLRGTVEKGLGEGKYYLSMSEYKHPFAQFLGREPYPGTLNLKVDADERTRFLAALTPTEIPGFVTKERTYGGVHIYPVRVGGRECGLIIPARTTHTLNKVEIVDSTHLRSTLHLKEGDVIIIERR